MLLRHSRVRACCSPSCSCVECQGPAQTRPGSVHQQGVVAQGAQALKVIEFVTA
jgi:hypothetical protein